MKRYQKFVLITFFVLFVMSCALIPAKPAGSDVPTNATEMRAFYSKYVSAEISDSAFYKRYEASYSQGFQTIAEKNKIAKDCSADYDQLVKDAMAGRFSPESGDGTPGTSIDANLAFNIYAPAENYPGDPTLCQQARLDLMKSIEVWRKNNVDLITQVYDRTAVRRKMLNDDIVKVAALEMADYAAEMAAANGYPSFERFTFPTYNLEVPSHSKELCDLYTDWANDPNKDGYIVPDDWNPVTKTCILRGLAAEEYMDKVFMPSEVAAIFDSGEETSPILGDETPAQ